MFTLEISWGDIMLFLSIVVSGVCHGAYQYNKGKKRGWDSAIFSCEESGYLKVDDETLEVTRVSDKEYNRLKQSNSFAE